MVYTFAIQPLLISSCLIGVAIAVQDYKFLNQLFLFNQDNNPPLFNRKKKFYVVTFQKIFKKELLEFVLSNLLGPLPWWSMPSKAALG